MQCLLGVESFSSGFVFSIMAIINGLEFNALKLFPILWLGDDVNLCWVQNSFPRAVTRSPVAISTVHLYITVAGFCNRLSLFPRYRLQR